MERDTTNQIIETTIANLFGALEDILREAKEADMPELLKQIENSAWNLSLSAQYEQHKPESLDKAKEKSDRFIPKAEFDLYKKLDKSK